MSQTTSVDRLVAELTRQNSAYRAGAPLVDDAQYDQTLERLRQMDPQHPYLHRVEPEAVRGVPIRHASPMLSTEKAVDHASVSAWVSRVQKAAQALGLPGPVKVALTPKLDGLAGFFQSDAGVLATRGDGIFGTNISACIERGLLMRTDRSGVCDGAGEIVVDQAFFESHLQVRYGFDHGRNFMAGLVGADTLKEHHRDALAHQACHFVPYSLLRDTATEMTLDELLAQWSQVMVSIRASVPYATDGVVVDVLDDRLRDALGATSHHHRATLALKSSAEVGETTIRSILWRTGRSGRCTPIAELESIYLSGANLSRCTLHNARTVETHQLAAGARIQIQRSGEVIPCYLSRVTAPTVEVALPTHCPSCSEALAWDSDFLVCTGAACPAQASAKLQHATLRLGIKGFGPKVCEVVSRVEPDPFAVIAQSADWFERAGISTGIARNLVAAVAQRKTEIVRDNDAIAALGLHFLGRGSARMLLTEHPWQSLGTLSASDLEAVDGFGAHTAAAIAPHLSTVVATLAQLVSEGFQLEATVRPSSLAESPVKGKKLVFTGAMSQPRAELEQQARTLGATVQSGVSATTDYLVVGERAGSKKAKAGKLGVTILPEADYLSMLEAPAAEVVPEVAPVAEAMSPVEDMARATETNATSRSASEPALSCCAEVQFSLF